MQNYNGTVQENCPECACEIEVKLNGTTTCPECGEKNVIPCHSCKRWEDMDCKFDLCKTGSGFILNECPNCEEKLEYRMFDIDGINLEEYLVCLKCSYGKPALM